MPKFNLEQYLAGKKDLVVEVLSPTAKIITTGHFDNFHKWTLEDIEYGYNTGYLEHDYYESVNDEFLLLEFHSINYLLEQIEAYTGEKEFCRNGDAYQYYLCNEFYAEKFVTHGFGGYILESSFNEMKKFCDSEDCPF